MKFSITNWQNKNLALYVAISIIVLGEFLVGYWLISLNITVRFLGFSLHVFLALLFSYLFKNINIANKPVNMNFILTALVLSLVLPVYGMLGMILVHIIIRTLKIEPKDYFEIDDTFLPEPYKALIKDFDDNIVEIKRDELEIDAFYDIFKSHDRDLEQNAVNKLAKLQDKHAITILKKIIATITSDTKMLATSALIEIEDKIIKKIEKIRNDVKNQPENFRLLLDLARTYDYYCYLGILDSVINDYYENLAIEHYKKFLEKDPTHAEASMEYGRKLLTGGQKEKAIQTLYEAINLSPNNPKPYLWLAEVFYEKTDYISVKKICRKLTGFENLPENCKEVVYWWAFRS